MYPCQHRPVTKEYKIWTCKHKDRGSFLMYCEISAFHEHSKTVLVLANFCSSLKSHGQDPGPFAGGRKGGGFFQFSGVFCGVVPGALSFTSLVHSALSIVVAAVHYLISLLIIFLIINSNKFMSNKLFLSQPVILIFLCLQISLSRSLVLFCMLTV